MKDIEYKVIRFLILIGILFLNYHVLMLFTSFIAPEGFLNDVKRIGGFFINLLGLHALFALGTFASSRLILKYQISFLMLGASVAIPVLYFFYNIGEFYDIHISNLFVIITSILFFDFLRLDFKNNYVRKYIKILTDPFYLADEDRSF